MTSDKPSYGGHGERPLHNILVVEDNKGIGEFISRGGPMKPNQWLAHFHTRTLPQKMELLLAQRETLLQQQHELLQRQATLARQQRELIERQTAHELRYHLFWLRLQQTACTEQSDESETLPAPGHPPHMDALLEFTSRLLSGSTFQRKVCFAEV